MSEEKYQTFNILSTDVRTRNTIDDVLVLDQFESENLLERRTVSTLKDGIIYYYVFTIDVDNIPIKEGCIKIPFDGEEFINFVRQECGINEALFVKSIEDKEKIDYLFYGYSYNYNFISKEFLVLSGQRMDIKYNGKTCFLKNGSRRMYVVTDMEKDEWLTFSGQIKFSLFPGKYKGRRKPFIHLIDVTSYTTTGSLTKSVK